MSGPQVRMKDIAARAGVSTVTVSKALAGYSGVSESMRSRIVMLAQEMGYEPVTERRKHKRSSFSVGVLVPEGYLSRTEPLYSIILRYVSEECARCQCNITTEIIGKQMEEKCSVPMVVREENMDGLILLGSFGTPYLEMLSQKSRVPLVYLGFMSDNSTSDSIISDGFYASCQITNYLLNRGHREIAFIGRILETPVYMEQYLGYVRAMTEHGIAVRKEWVITGHRLETPDILPTDQVTAYVCGSDAVAHLLYQELTRLGIRCPEDVSIVKFGNDGYSACKEEDFTVYKLDNKEMARKAVHALLRRMNGEYTKKHISIVTGHFQEKESVRVRNSEPGTGVPCEGGRGS